MKQLLNLKTVFLTVFGIVILGILLIEFDPLYLALNFKSKFVTSFLANDLAENKKATLIVRSMGDPESVEFLLNDIFKNPDEIVSAISKSPLLLEGALLNCGLSSPLDAEANAKLNKNYQSSFEILLKRGLNPNFQVRPNINLLMQASTLFCYGAVEALLKYGADIKLPEGSLYKTVLEELENPISAKPANSITSLGNFNPQLPQKPSRNKKEIVSESWMTVEQQKKESVTRGLSINKTIEILKHYSH